MFNKIGYGEHTEDQAELESEYLTRVIQEQLRAMDFLDSSAKSKLEEILLRNKETFAANFQRFG